MEQTTRKIQKFVCSKLEFFNAFVEEGLKFSSSLYLLLIWVRVRRFVFQNPAEVSEHMVNVPFFSTFQKALTCEHYIDALVQSKAGLLILQPATPANTKRGLVEIDSEEGDRFRGRQSSGGNAKKKKKKTKQM